MEGVRLVHIDMHRQSIDFRRYAEEGVRCWHAAGRLISLVTDRPASRVHQAHGHRPVHPAYNPYFPAARSLEIYSIHELTWICFYLITGCLLGLCPHSPRDIVVIKLMAIMHILRIYHHVCANKASGSHQLDRSAALSWMILPNRCAVSI
jgi:hypothetical protein